MMLYMNTAWTDLQDTDVKDTGSMITISYVSC